MSPLAPPHNTVRNQRLRRLPNLIQTIAPNARMSFQGDLYVAGCFP